MIKIRYKLEAIIEVPEELSLESLIDVHFKIKEKLKELYPTPKLKLGKDRSLFRELFKREYEQEN